MDLMKKHLLKSGKNLPQISKVLKWQVKKTDYFFLSMIKSFSSLLRFFLGFSQLFVSFNIRLYFHQKKIVFEYCMWVKQICIDLSKNEKLYPSPIKYLIGQI